MPLAIVVDDEKLLNVFVIVASPLFKKSPTVYPVLVQVPLLVPAQKLTPGAVNVAYGNDEDMFAVSPALVESGVFVQIVPVTFASAGFALARTKKSPIHIATAKNPNFVPLPLEWILIV